MISRYCGRLEEGVALVLTVPGSAGSAAFPGLNCAPCSSPGPRFGRAKSMHGVFRFQREIPSEVC